MQDYDGLVGIYSTRNKLTEILEEKFRQKYLDVKVFDTFENIDLDKLSYLIINLIDLKRDTPTLLKILSKITCKVILLHSLYVKKTEKFVVDADIKQLLDINSNLGVILTPDILGKDIEYKENYLSHNLIKQYVLSERIKINDDGAFVNTVTISKIAERVIKDTFSFGVSGEILSITGPRKSKKSFIIKYLGVDEQNIIYTKEEDNIVQLHTTSSVKVDFSLKLAVNNTIKNFKNNTVAEVEEKLMPIVVSDTNTKVRKKQKVFNFKVVYYFLIFASMLFTIPFFLILLSFFSLYFSYKYVFTNNDISNYFVNKSMQMSSLTKNISFGNNFIYDNANIVYEASNIGGEAIALTKNTRDFLLNIMSDQSYDLSKNSNTISASLEKIHTEISFLQSDINDLNGITGKIMKNILYSKNIDIGEYKNNLYYLKNFFSRISLLLGNEKPKKYLILFQNNMEIRPTGGFIGSYGLLTFDKGRLTEINISDVYSADGQLKGHVDPPEPIRKHLGEGGWYLRDSNWDPNFPDSATKAEWFFDKEVGESVDGVISVDLFFVKKLLSVVGPVKLADFDKTVDQNNLYTLIQNEVEDTFFPGSIKKATILTSLTKTLINEVESLSSDKYVSLFKEIYESLEQKHIQVYLHDTNAQKALSMLEYTGEYNLSTDCNLRCFKDKYALVDANLGVNKANFFIERSQGLNLTISKASINHELIVSYKNNASSAIGNTGIYKNYARLLLPMESEVSGVRVYNTDNSYSDIEYERVDINGRQEIGFLIDVLPSTTKVVQIVWSIQTDKLSQGGEYNLNILKQSGTEADNLSVNIYTSDLSLTGRKVSKYNTNLRRDFKQRIFLK